MKTHSCDILVIGAGPAGASVSFAAANNGWDVLMIEQKPVIGIPVRCAELIPVPLLREIDIGKGFIIQRVKGMRTMLPDGSIYESAIPGFIIRRDIFDQALALKAGMTGARIWTRCKLISLDKNGALVRSGGETYIIKARIVIGADGPYSRVARCIKSVNKNLIPAIQVTADLARPMDFTEVYFNREMFGGYGWLFPKGNRANIGVALRKRSGISFHIKETLDRFIARLRECGKIEGAASGVTAGLIPAERPRMVVHKNIMLAGDAAGQTHPISGAGVAQAVTCGMMAGEWASRALEMSNMGLLREYDNQWREHYGEALERAYSRRLLMEREWDHLDDIVKYCWIGFREYYGGR